MNRKIDAMHERFGRHDGICKECGNLECYYQNGRYYYKCKVYGNSRSAATDWRLSWDACGMYNSLWTGRTIIELLKSESKKEPILPPEGQITFEWRETIKEEMK